MTLFADRLMAMLNEDRNNPREGEMKKISRSETQSILR
jgi:hypothetical protein